MKKMCYLIIILQGCCLLKQLPVDVTNSLYICEKGGMVGNTTIQFNDSTFVYTERGGLFQGEGIWYESPNRQSIFLKGILKVSNYEKVDTKIKKEIDIELEKKGKKTLLGDGCVFILQKH